MRQADEVRRWLGNLGGQSIHGSKDTDAENPMAKLIEYGLRAGIPELDEKMLPYAEQVQPKVQTEDNYRAHTAVPFLIAAGYHHHPQIEAWFRQRLAILNETAITMDTDLFLADDEKADIPAAWNKKPVYRARFFDDTGFRLPSCYDFYAMAHWSMQTEIDADKILAIVAYLSQEEFQRLITGKAYGYSPAQKRCWAMGQAFMACISEARKVLFLELAARFASCRQKTWFQTPLAELEACRTSNGTWLFPAPWLKETANSYYLYSGAHMGLAENRRNRLCREIESTFRMLNLKRLLQVNQPAHL